MPTYTYQCTDCGAAFDQFQKFAEDPLTECPTCHGQVKRVIHPVGIVFKGSGWYITDSRSGTPDTAVPATPPSSTEPAAAATTAEPATAVKDAKPVEKAAAPKPPVETKAAS